MFAQISRGIILLWGVTFVLLGCKMMVSPSMIIESNSVEPLNSLGWSTLSSNIASLYVVLGIFALMGAFKNDRTMLFNIVIIEAIVVIGRFVAIFQHGFMETMTVWLIAELGIATIILNHIRLLDKKVQ